MAISGPTEHDVSASALPPKADVGKVVAVCSLIAASHTRARFMCLTGLMVLSGVGAV